MPKPFSPTGNSIDRIFKFAIYNPHYKDIFISNLTQTFVCTTQPGLVTQTGKTSRVVLYDSHSFQSLFLFFSLTLSKCAAIFEYVVMPKWQLNSTLASFSLLRDYLSVKQTSENVIKAVENRKYLTSTQNPLENSFDLFSANQIVEILLRDITLLNKQLQ